MELEDLPGVGGTTADRLRESGFNTVESIAVANPGAMKDVAGLGESAATRVINAARESLQMGFMTGTEVWEKRQTLKKIRTSSDKLRCESINR